MNHEGFGDLGLLWSTVSFVIIVSMIVHGASATWVMRYVDKGRVA
jgi:NhaP-type Na+/H+ or K+/H+ antiporter